MKVYPVFLNDLERRHGVVIGGDGVAEQKVRGLLACDTAVSVISPDLTPPLQTWHREGRLTWIARAYRHGDLQDAFLVIVTESDPQCRADVWDEANAAGVLINVVDDAAHSNFIAGSVLYQGALRIAISTSGIAPALAVRIREELERRFGPEYAVFLELLGEVRPRLTHRVADFVQRRALWYALIDSDVLDLVRAGDLDRARQRIAEILTRVP